MKIDKEIIEESKKEIRKLLKEQEPEDAHFEESYDKKEDTATNNNQKEPVENNNGDKEKEIEDKFQKYADKFKSFTGRAIIEFVDDFKTNALWLYALKNKINIPKDALKMPEDGKDLCSTLIDYVLQDKLLYYIKKYPLLAAGALIGVNAGSTYLLIETLKKENKQEDKKEPTQSNNINHSVEDTINNLA
ncbi:MAG: hypothetical protein OHK0036_11320 [Bacteroidia bacterium]